MITLCLMVKNEEPIVGRLFDSVSGIVQRAIVMDTGSTDNTKQVITESCERHGIDLVLFDHEWVNFGANRTELMNTAYLEGSDWFLLLDADMELQGTIDESELTADSYMLRYAGDLDYAQKLLVTGKFQWEYVGSTHEYIQPAHLEPTSVATYDRAVILHHQDGASRSVKHERDVSYLQDEVGARSIFYLAQTYRELGDFDRAIKFYETRAELGGWEEERWYATYQAAALRQCPEKLLDAYSLRPWRVEPLYHLGSLLRERQSYAAAVMVLRQAAEIQPPQYDMLFIERWMHDWGVDFELAIALWWNDQQDESRKLHNDLLTRDIPDHIRERVEINLSF